MLLQLLLPASSMSMRACLQEALEADAEREMGGLGRSISSMSFGSGEREQMAHQLSSNAGSSPHLLNTGAALPLTGLRAAMHSIRALAEGFLSFSSAAMPGSHPQ